MRQPCHLGVGARAGVGAAVGHPLLVLPVRGDTELGALVHLVRADLDLDRTPLRADHGGVQGLIQVELRGGDVVLEPSRDRIPARVDRAEDRVAVADVVDEDADADQVVDVAELAAAHDHLLVDRVVLLRPTDHLTLDAALAQILRDRVDHLLHELLALRRALAHHALDLDVELGVQDREAEILELPLDGLDSEAVREWRVDLQRLLSLAPRRLGRNEAPRAGVVQPVRELDDEHADVLAHRDDHLAHGLGLGAVAILQLVELRDAVDEHRDLVAEVGTQLLEPVVGVFDGVMQQRGGKGLRADPEVGEDLRDRDRMRDVGLPALPGLPGVRLVRDPVGALDEREISLGMVRAHRAQQPLHRAGWLGAREQAGKNRPQRGGALCLRLGHRALVLAFMN